MSKTGYRTSSKTSEENSSKENIPRFKENHLMKNTICNTNGAILITKESIIKKT